VILLELAIFKLAVTLRVSTEQKILYKIV